MNRLSTLAGLTLAIVVLVGGILTSSSNWTIFVNGHAFLVVVGGTLAATLISFPVTHLLRISRVIWRRLSGLEQPPHLKVVDEVINLAKGLQGNDNFLQANVEQIRTPFLKEAIELYLGGGISDQKVDVILRKRAEVHLVRYEDEAHSFKTIAKFPPAFGLLGAVLGMIALMSGLGSPDSFKLIGPAMALALVATMYGIAIANLVFSPLGENLAKFSREDHLMRNIVIDAVRLLREREHPLVVEEYLKSYLLSTERLQMASSSSAGASGESQDRDAA